MSVRIAHGRKSPVVCLLVLSGVIGLGCAAAQLGATPSELAKARSQSEQGARLFADQCGSCHGQSGEGQSGAPEILGPGALPEYPRSSAGSSGSAAGDPQLLQIEAQARPAGAAWRDPFRTAQDLYAFSKTHMPKGNTSELTAGDHWAIVGFMLAAQGAKLPAGGLGPANASSIQVPRR